MPLILLIFIVSLFFNLKAHAGVCPEGEYWVSGHPRSEYHRADGTPVSAAEVIGHCRSKGKSYQYWATELSNGTIEGWPHKKEKMKEWSRRDFESVVRALGKLPEGLWEKTKIYRSDQSQTPENPATSASGIIVLYDSAFRDLEMLPRYLAHELAHQKFKKLSSIDVVAYQQIAEWRETPAKAGGTNLVLKRVKTMASDSDLSPEEDFANNLEYFLYEAEKLRAKSPAIYDWFHVEYGDKIKAGGSK